jgi:hypothetical protein
LADLPQAPEWSINGTTAENGKRFRFKRHDIGDYTLGYASAERFPLASALAVSAAFPGGFGPLTLDACRFEWRRRSWNDPPEAARPVDVPYRKLHLYDGGVYDNMGLEPFFDAGRQRPKHEDGLGDQRRREVEIACRSREAAGLDDAAKAMQGLVAIHAAASGAGRGDHRTGQCAGRRRRAPAEAEPEDLRAGVELAQAGLAGGGVESERNQGRSHRAVSTDRARRCRSERFAASPRHPQGRKR